MFRSIALQTAACYVRHCGFEPLRWRLSRYALAEVKRIGPQMGQKKVRTRHGFVMRLDLRDWVAQHIFATGNYEDYTARTIQQLLSPGDLMIDVGANIGFFTLLGAQRVGPQGQVFAFEPAPETRDILSANLSLNQTPNVRVFPQAVSNAEGTIQLHVGPAEHLGISSIRESLSERSSHTVEIPATTLDSVLDAQSVPRLIKIDVEGAEMQALQGMHRVLAETKPDLVLEVSDIFLRELGSSAAELCTLLGDYGYRAWHITWDYLKPIDLQGKFRGGQFNALFSQRSKLPESLQIV